MYKRQYQDIAGEIEHRVETLEQFNYGVSRFIMGLGKKVLIANTAGKICESFLGTDYSRLPVTGAWLGIFLFALQIYFDFTGYSDMAIGLGTVSYTHLDVYKRQAQYRPDARD